MNHENALLDALEELLNSAGDIPLHAGGTESFAAVSVGSEQFNIGYPAVSLIPVGPVFASEVLGTQSMNRRSRYVTVNLEVDYEHPDKEQGVRNMSDILWFVASLLLDSPRLAGCEALEIGNVDYAYAVQDANTEDTEKNNIPDWGYKGKAILPIVALWKYR